MKIMNYIEKFKRYYHKVRKVILEFGDTGISTLKIGLLGYWKMKEYGIIISGNRVLAEDFL
jgi:hypothetical protein